MIMHTFLETVIFFFVVVCAHKAAYLLVLGIIFLHSDIILILTTVLRSIQVLRFRNVVRRSIDFLLLLLRHLMTLHLLLASFIEFRMVRVD